MRLLGCLFKGIAKAENERPAIVAETTNRLISPVSSIRHRKKRVYAERATAGRRVLPVAPRPGERGIFAGSRRVVRYDAWDGRALMREAGAVAVTAGQSMPVAFSWRVFLRQRLVS